MGRRSCSSPRAPWTSLAKGTLCDRDMVIDSESPLRVIALWSREAIWAVPVGPLGTLTACGPGCRIGFGRFAGKPPAEVDARKTPLTCSRTRMG